MSLQRESISEDFFDFIHPTAMNLLSSASEQALYHVRLELFGEELLWNTITENRLFHYSEEICGSIFGGSFSKDKPYIITLSLKPDLIGMLSITADDKKNLAPELFYEHNDVLRQSDSWLLLSVMQQKTPKTQWGMTTSFFKEEL